MKGYGVKLKVTLSISCRSLNQALVLGVRVTGHHLGLEITNSYKLYRQPISLTLYIGAIFNCIVPFKKGTSEGYILKEFIC